MLGYRDSGMAGSESNAHPDSFAQAPLDEALERYWWPSSGEPDPRSWSSTGTSSRATPSRPPSGPRGRDWQRSASPGTLTAIGKPVIPGSRASSTTRCSRRPGSRRSTRSSRNWASSPPSTRVAQALGGHSADPITTSIDISEFADVRRRGAAGPCHPGRSELTLLVRAAARGDALHPSLRRLPPGAGRRAGRHAPVPGEIETEPVRRTRGGESDLFAGCVPASESAGSIGSVGDRGAGRSRGRTTRRGCRDQVAVHGVVRPDPGDGRRSA
jgi:hypothetical protein